MSSSYVGTCVATPKLIVTTPPKADGTAKFSTFSRSDSASARALSLGANALQDDGQHERALRWSRRALQLFPEEPGVIINAACLRAKQGMNDEALEILDLGTSRGLGNKDWIMNDPDLASLHDDPRFQALIDKLG